MKLKSTKHSPLFISLYFLVTGCNTSRCSSNQFECKNTLCVNEYSKCDGTNDCGDHSDENPMMCGE